MTRRVPAAAGLGLALAAVPAPVFAHGLVGRLESPLPLAVYLTGAALTVALSFAFVLLRGVEAEDPAPGRPMRPPAWLTVGLRVVGLLAWAWIIVQGVIGGSSDAGVAPLFLWVYGWVALAMVSAFIGPAWTYLDPFATLHDIGAAILRRFGVRPWERAPYPRRLGRWPAVAGFAVVVWLELALFAGQATLFITVVGYTALSLAMMAQFGRDEWRSQADVFTVWYGLLGRLAPIGPVEADGRLRRRPFASGLRAPGWSTADIVIVALAVGSILFDGLSQTKIWFDAFGLPTLAGQTGLLAAFLGVVVLGALGVSRLVGLAATGAGLLPIAIGYLVAHYLTFLLGDGQRIAIAISDPFQLGWDLFGTAFFEPGTDWIPAGLLWTAQLVAVVGGHMVGAWSGHVVAARTAPAGVDVRRRQVPLVLLMVALTVTTLWSLGQELIAEPAERPISVVEVSA